MTERHSLPKLDSADCRLQDKVRKLRLLVFDFDAVFTDNKVYVGDDGTERFCCSRADGLGLRLLEEVGVAPIILSTEKNPVVLKRAEKLNIEARNALEDKAHALREEAHKRSLNPDQIGYVGNDINDLDCLRLAGLSIVVADAHKAVLPFAHFITNTDGGKGAVREICDLVHAIRSEKEIIE